MKHSYKLDLTKCTSRFDTKTKIKRFAWSFMIWPVLRYLPRKAGSFIRIIVLRLFGAKIGSACLIEAGVKVWIPWRLELADYVAIGRDVEIYNYDVVKIGGMSVISQGCFLCTGSHDYENPDFSLIWKPIEIGSEVWVASGSFIHPGVKIQDGAVVGARSVVTKDVPAWTVCAGNPAKGIKQRVIRAR